MSEGNLTQNSQPAKRQRGITDTENDCMIIEVGETYIYKWTITDFPQSVGILLSPMQVALSIKSPKFNFLEGGQLTWRLVLYPCGSYPEFSQYLSLYLQLCQSTSALTTEVEVECWFSLIKKNKSITNKKMVKKRKYSIINNNTQGLGNYILRSEVLDPMNDLLSNNQLTILCEMRHIRVTSVSGPTPPIPYKLSTDFGTLLGNQMFSDVKLISSTGKEFKAHKIILAARSPVFAAMFQHNMRENQEGVVDLSDTSSKLIEAMLKYIYVDEVPELKEIARKLFMLAHKYDLCGLKVECENSLCKALTVNNVLEYLIFADLYNTSILKEHALHFIKTRRKLIIESAEFATFMKRQSEAIMMEVVRAISS